MYVVAWAVDILIVNFDGIVFSNSNSSGVGAVIRNYNGVVMASCAEKLNQAYKAEEIEVLAALKALQFAFDLGFQNADRKSVV